jgi:putative ABC transport system substrate-binding protein
VRLQTLEARNLQEIDSAFAVMTTERARALLILPDGVFVSQRGHIAELAVKRRLPSVYGMGEYAESGGLMTYSASFLDMHRGAAAFVDKILKGTKPADLPVTQPTKFELVINLRTAKAIGLTIPPSLVQRADQIID